LTNYFLNPKNQNQIINNNVFINNRDEPQLSPIYLELIQKLWPKNYDYNSFSPTVFINIVEKMNPLLKNGQSGDLKDFITFLLEQFHKELRKSKENNRDINNRNVTINHYDKQETMNYFFEEFMKETSIISDLFFGIIETTTVCQNCKVNYNSRGMNNPIFYDYQKINCIIFPLDEINNYKNSDMQNINFNYYMNQNNIVSIYDCFIFYQKTKILNQYFCKDCNQVNDSLYTTNIHSPPNILIIILDRGKDNVFNVKFEFTERIDITNFILAKEKPIIEYDLYGVIALIENTGRFIASCKSSLDNKWYRYNDSIVTPINDIRRDVIDFGTLYILFYQKK
jgi:ubiquitin C-terminal hydrolase